MTRCAHCMKVIDDTDSGLGKCEDYPDCEYTPIGEVDFRNEQ